MSSLASWNDSWVLAETPELLVLNKPSGLALLADRTGETNLWTLAKARYPGLKLVHRIDKGTSGILLLARSASVQATLTRAFQERRVHKRYLAVTTGRFPTGSYQLNLPLRPGRKSRYRVAAPRESIHLEGRSFRCTPDGGEAFEAITHARLLGYRGDCSVVLLRPHTGRRHQLRVQLAWLGFPILGDTLYGKPKEPAQAASRLHLHASSILLPNQERFTAPSPKDWLNLNDPA